MHGRRDRDADLASELDRRADAPDHARRRRRRARRHAERSVRSTRDCRLPRSTGDAARPAERRAHRRRLRPPEREASGFQCPRPDGRHGQPGQPDERADRRLQPALLEQSRVGHGGSGGTCFGDSGGPVIHEGKIVGVNSFVLNANCKGSGFAYRVDTGSARSFLDDHTAVP
ncbi:MAG: trypsin-like serine protease [Gaiellaceae bacterium]